MNKQEFYREKYRLLNPEWRNSLIIYRDLIATNTEPGTAILDIGCGHADFLEKVYIKSGLAFGIDPDKQALLKNVSIPYCVVGFGGHIPFKDNTFDLVLAAWVLEHVDKPDDIAKEVYRVLKPGGKFIFLTTNIWNYNVWIIRAIPNAFHGLLVKKLYKRVEEDTYPVAYKFNSPKKIDRILNQVGLKKEALILNGDPSYISFNDLLFLLARIVERVLSTSLFKFARVHIIGIYQKTQGQ
ncbi:MAG: SAM-dependent methyltransferase [Herpetosiphonaceae bacterium]|nr:MAG: SAM-dependent methyltransferase [Herpetosiphonaceae bacterium]